MLREGLYRDRDGRTAYVCPTITGYLIRYADGQTVMLANPSNHATTLARSAYGHLALGDG